MVKHPPSRLSEPELRQAAPQPLARDELWLCGGFLTAPLAWALHFVLSYGLVYPAERWQSKAVLHCVALAAALACGSCILLGWIGLRRSRDKAFVDSAQRDRTRFLSMGACLLGAFFLLAIAAQSIVVGVLSLEGHP
jgi:hypothetical protein